MGAISHFRQAITALFQPNSFLLIGLRIDPWIHECSALRNQSVASCPFFKPFVLIFMHVMGSTPSISSTGSKDRAKSARFKPCALFCTRLRFFASQKSVTPMFSSSSALFAKNTGCGVPQRFMTGLSPLGCSQHRKSDNPKVTGPLDASKGPVWK
jgi:hypothetical protein